jgi:hypothetical protein
MFLPSSAKGEGDDAERYDWGVSVLCGVRANHGVRGRPSERGRS